MGKYITLRSLKGEIKDISEKSYTDESFMVLTVPNKVYEGGGSKEIEEKIVLHKREDSILLNNLLRDHLDKRGNLRIEGEVRTKLTLFRRRPRFFDYNGTISVDGREKYKIKSRTVTRELGYWYLASIGDEITQLEK